MKDNLDRPIRRSIFRRELDGIWAKYKIPEEFQEQFLRSTFENHIQINEQFFVKSEIGTRRELNRSIQNLPEIIDAAKDIERVFIIESDLNIPADLQSEFINHKNKIAFFLGAGASKSLGYDDWSELGTKAIKELYRLDFINSYERERIEEKIKDPKQKLTIFESVIAPPGKFKNKKECDIYRIFYETIFKKNPDANSSKEISIYDLIVNFKTIITYFPRVDRTVFIEFPGLVFIKSCRAVA